MKRLRLLSVDVQARFVIDDGDTLEEVTGQPVRLSPAELVDYAERLEADRAAQEQVLNADSETS